MSKESVIKALDIASYVFFICFVGLLPLLGSVSLYKLYFLPNIAFIALSVTTTIVFFLKKQYLLVSSRYFWPILVFLIGVIVSSLINGLFFGIASNLLYIFVSIVVTFFVVSNESIKKLFFIVFISCLTFSSVYLLFYCIDHFLKVNFSLVSLFGNSNQLTYYFLFLEIYSAVCFAQLFLRRKLWIGFLFFLPLIIALAAGLLAGSKAFFIISFISLAFSIFFFFGKDRLLTSTIITFALIALTVIVLSLPVFTNIRSKLFVFLGFVTEGYEHDYSSAERLDMFKTALYLFAQKPLFGWGANGFSNNNIFWAYSHSNLSEVLCNFGLIGFLSFNSTLALPFYPIIRHKRIKENENIFLCCVLSIMLLFGQITNVFFVIKFIFVIIGLIIGTIILLQKKHLLNNIFKGKDLHYEITI